MPGSRIRRYSRDPIRDKFVERKESMAGFSMSFWSLHDGYCGRLAPGIQMIIRHISRSSAMVSKEGKL